MAPQPAYIHPLLTMNSFWGNDFFRCWHCLIRQEHQNGHFKAFLYLRNRKVIKDIVKWMKTSLLVQFIAVIQITIFSERSLAILKSKMALFRPKITILRPFWYRSDRKVKKNILKWMKWRLLVQFIAAIKITIFSKNFGFQNGHLEAKNGHIKPVRKTGRQ